MTAVIEKIRNRIRGETGVRTALILGIAGMLLIMLSGLLPDHTRQSSAGSQAAEAPAPESADSYREELESRLTALLSQMEGVGTVTVMVTVRGSAEQVYAEEVKASENEHGSQKESAYVLTKSDGKESALVAETKYPRIQGVAVLCSGGDHAAVQERVSKAVSAVLGIPAAQIYIGKASVS